MSVSSKDPLPALASQVVLIWQELRFKKMCLESPTVRFEDIFCAIMRKANPESFHISRSGGPQGDESCDGWDSKTRTLYAVYAPLTPTRRRSIKGKILHDFKGAKQRWPEMQRWRMVHNDLFGLAAQANRELETLRNDPISAGIEILSDWTPEDLWRILRGLPEVERGDLVGVPEWTKVLSDGSNFENAGLRFHDELHPAAAMAACRSLTHLCSNFQPGGVLDDRAASVFASALTSWWADDDDLHGAYLELLLNLSDSMGFETQLTCLAFVMRCAEVCARRLGATRDAFVATLLSKDHPTGEAARLILEIVDAEFGGQGEGFWVSNEKTRRKFVEACGATITELVTFTSTTKIPIVFLLQDLFTSMQSIDYADGTLVC